MADRARIVCEVENAMAAYALLVSPGNVDLAKAVFARACSGSETDVVAKNYEAAAALFRAVDFSKLVWFVRDGLSSDALSRTLKTETETETVSASVSVLAQVATEAFKGTSEPRTRLLTLEWCLRRHRIPRTKELPLWRAYIWHVIHHGFSAATLTPPPGVSLESVCYEIVEAGLAKDEDDVDAAATSRALALLQQVLDASGYGCGAT